MPKNPCIYTIKDKNGKIVKLSYDDMRKHILDNYEQYNKELLKYKENAVSIEKSNEVDVRQQTKNGEGVGKGNTESESTTTESKPNAPNEKAQKIADFIRKGKIDKDILMSGVPFAKEVWNGAVETMAKTVELTGDVVKAIEEGIAHIKKSDWYKNLSEENKTKAENRFKQEYSEEKIAENSDKIPPINGSGDGSTNPLGEGVPLTHAELSKIKPVEEWLKTFKSSTFKEFAQKGFQMLLDKYPNTKNIFNAVMQHADHINTLRSKGEYGNSTAQDIAVFDYAFNELKNNQADHESVLNDPNASEQAKDAASIELNNIGKQILELAKAANNSEIGQALGALQMITLKDPKLGYTVRRMQYLESKGEENFANEKDKENFNQLWAKEKADIEENHRLRYEAQAKEFAATIDKLEKENTKLKEQSNTSFKEKSKNAADTFRKLKTKPFQFRDENGNLIDIQQASFLSWNDMVEIGAKAIEKTGEIADGVAEIIKKIKEKDLDWYKKLSDSDKDKFEKDLENHFSVNKREPITKEKALDNIKTFAENNGDTTLTNDMVKKGLLKKLIDGHLKDGVSLEKALDAVHKDLKKVLPETTRQDVVDAVKRVGKFTPETKAKVNEDLNKKNRDLKALTNLQSQLEKLINDGRIDSGNPKKANEVTKEITAIKERIKYELFKQNIKKSSGTVADKEAFKSLANEHDTRIQDHIDYLKKQAELTDNAKVKNGYNDVINQLEKAKIGDIGSGGDYKTALAKANEKLANLETKGITDKEVSQTITKTALSNKDAYETSAKDIQMQIDIRNAIKANETKIGELNRKIKHNEFEDEPKRVVPNYSDPALAASNRELSYYDSMYKALKNKAEKRNAKTLSGTNAKILLGMFRDFVIGSLGTAAKLVPASAYRIAAHVASSKWFNLVGKHFMNDALIVNAAAEGEFTNGVRNALKMTFSFKNEKEATAYIKTMQEVYDKENDIIESKLKDLRELEPTKKSKAKIADLEKEQNLLLAKSASQMLLSSFGMGGNWVKMAWDKTIKGSSDIDMAKGHYSKLDWNLYDYDAASKAKFDALPFNEKRRIVINEALNTLANVSSLRVSIHGAFKSPAQRYMYSMGVMGKMFADIKSNPNIDLGNPMYFEQVAFEQYAKSFERGAYLHYNELASKVGEFIGNLGSSKSKEAKALGTAISANKLVGTVPANIVQSLVGDVLGGTMYSQIKQGILKYDAAKKALGTKGVLETYKQWFTKAKEAEFKEAFAREMSNVPPDVAAKIIRAARVGNFALPFIIMGLTTGIIKYGGAGSKTSGAKDDKKKDDELKSSEISIAGVEMPRVVGKSLEHFDVFGGILKGIELKDKYNEAKEKGNTVYTSSMKSGAEVAEELIDENPMLKMIGFTDMIKHTAKTATDIPSKFTNQVNELTAKGHQEIRDKKKIEKYLDGLTDDTWNGFDKLNYFGKDIDTKYKQEIADKRNELLQKNVDDLFAKKEIHVVRDGKDTIVTPDNLKPQEVTKYLSKYAAKATAISKKEIFAKMVKELGSDYKKEAIESYRNTRRLGRKVKKENK